MLWIRLPSWVVASGLLLACNSGFATAAAGSRGDATVVQGTEVLSCVDLPRADPRSHDLSGLAWDPVERLLYAISDREKRLVVLAPRPGFLGYDFRPPIALDIEIKQWDGEALAIAADQFIVVANETEQAVFTVDRSGGHAMPITLPRLRGVRPNLGFEGLSYVSSSTGRYVFAVNEEALEGDGPTSTAAHGTVVRIIRHRLDGRDDLEVAYLTDPIFATGARGSNGVSDLAALSPERLLVLERAYVPGRGNAIRVYQIVLAGAHDIAGLVDARAALPVAKHLVVDLAAVPDQRCAVPPQSQRRRTLENYEGLALGPTLDDGRRLLWMVSDDNSNDQQNARIIALALAPGAL